MVTWLPVATLVSTDAAVNHGWCTPFGCVSEALLAKAFLLFGLLALVCFALAALSFVPEARAVVREEHSRAKAERDAFERFRRKVASLDVTPTRMPDGGQALGVGTLSVSEPPDEPLARARDAYRETVMAVDHYEVEYDEPLATNLGAEFGEGVAEALVNGQMLTPALRTTLVEGASDASDRRAKLCRALDAEADTLRESAATLREVERTVEAADGPTLSESYDSLTRRWDRLQEAEGTVEGVLADQQSELHEEYGVAPRLGGPVSLHEYLYADEAYTHPVLAEGADLLESLQEQQDRTALALARRV